ncbi:MAG: exo-alpha-sialidase [Verrucomicrobia bacterium]|nr:exo-alpha-sialidase [Verrucomicrobiota bacterium]
MIAALGGGCAVIERTPLQGPVGFFTAPSVKLEEPFIIAQSDYTLGHGFYSFPFVRRMPNGLLLVAYTTEGDVAGSSRVSVDELGEQLGHIDNVGSPAISEDNGQTWRVRSPDGLLQHSNTSAQTFFYHNRRSIPEPLVGAIVRADGSQVAFEERILAIMAKYGSGLRDQWQGVSAKMSSSVPEPWSSPSDVLFEIPALQRSLVSGEAVRLFGNGVELPDKTLLLAGYSWGMTPYRHESPLGYATVLFASIDGGNTFTTRSVIASGKDYRHSREGLSEPALVRLPDGELLCLMRTGAGGGGDRIRTADPMLIARSRDEGTTWSKSVFPRSGVSPRLLVMSDGTLVCTYGRPGNALIASSDGGRTWGWTHYLSPADWPTTGYTDLVEIGPGRLLVVYDLWDYDPVKKRAALPGDGANVVMGRFVTIGTPSER